MNSRELIAYLAQIDSNLQEGAMNPREQLQRAYELAFFPPSLHRLWTNIRTEQLEDRSVTVELLKMALVLHQMLPETGFSSLCALKRLALYQANAR